MKNYLVKSKCLSKNWRWLKWGKKNEYKMVIGPRQKSGVKASLEGMRKEDKLESE